MQGGLDGEDTLLDTLRDTLAATLEDTLADSPSHICNHSPKETPTETLTETLRETLTDGLKDIGTPRDSSNLSTRREDTHRDSCRDCKDVRTDGLIVPNQTLHSLEAFPALPSSAATPPTAHWTPLLAARKTAPELRLEIPLAKQKKQLGASTRVADFCKTAMAKLGCRITHSQAHSLALVFVLTGHTEKVAKARLLLLGEFAIPEQIAFILPATCRSNIIGRAAAVIKRIMDSTHTKVKLETTGDVLTVFITGAMLAVQEAKDEIELVVTASPSRFIQRIPIDRSYHPLIAGPNNTDIELIQLEQQVNIFTTNLRNSAGTEGEILVIGVKENVITACNIIISAHESLSRATKTILVDITAQKQYLLDSEFITEILNQTGCVVHSMGLADVLIRGPPSCVSTAAELVLQLLNSSFLQKLNLSAVMLGSDPTLLAQYLTLRHSESISNIVNVNQIKLRLHKGIFEIHAKCEVTLAKSLLELQQLVARVSKSIFILPMDIPFELQKFIHGNESISKLLTSVIKDIIVPKSIGIPTKVLVAISRNVEVSACEKLVSDLKKEVMISIAEMADSIELNISIDSKFHGKLIGTKGSALATLLAPYPDVTVRFAKLESIDPHLITIRGPKANADQVSSAIYALVRDWKNMDEISSFSKQITVSSGAATKLLGTGFKSTGWIIQAIRAQHLKAPIVLLENERGISIDSGNLNMSFAVKEKGKQEIITIRGPQTIVLMCVEIINSKIMKLEFISHKFNIFQTSTMNPDLDESSRDRIFSRVILKYTNDKKRDSSVIVEFEKRGSKGFTVGNIEIRGSKEAIDETKNILVHIASIEVTECFSVRFDVPTQAIPHIIGQKGANLSRIISSNTQVNFEKKSSEESVCIVFGKEVDCLAAKESILKIVLDLKSTAECSIMIPRALHKLIIGTGGTNIQRLISGLGENSKLQVKFPSPESNSDQVRILASESFLDNAKLALLNLVKDVSGVDIVEGAANGTTCKSLFIADASYQTLVSKGVLLEAMRTFGVTIWNIASQNAVFEMRLCGVNEDAVTDCEHFLNSPYNLVESPAKLEAHGMVGNPDLSDFSKVSLEILLQNDLENVSLTIEIPASSRGHIIGRQGKILKRIEADFGVRIELEKDTTKGTVIIHGKEMGSTDACRNHIIGILQDREARETNEPYSLLSVVSPILSVETVVSARMAEKRVSLPVLFDPSDVNSSAVSSCMLQPVSKQGIWMAVEAKKSRKIATDSSVAKVVNVVTPLENVTSSDFKTEIGPSTVEKVNGANQRRGIVILCDNKSVVKNQVLSIANHSETNGLVAQSNASKSRKPAKALTLETERFCENIELPIEINDSNSGILLQVGKIGINRDSIHAAPVKKGHMGNTLSMNDSSTIISPQLEKFGYPCEVIDAAPLASESSNDEWKPVSRGKAARVASTKTVSSSICITFGDFAIIPDESSKSKKKRSKRKPVQGGSI